MSSTPSRPDASGPKDGWTPLGPYNWLTPTLSTSAASGLGLALLANFAFQLVNGIFEANPGGLGIVGEILAFIATMLLALSLIVVIQRLRFPRPFADFTTHELKVGRRIISFEDISWARFAVVIRRGERSRLVLFLGAEGGPRLIFNLATDGRRAMSATTREQLMRVISESKIVLPSSTYDPSGRFARYNFPTSLDKELALNAVKDPAGAMENLHVA